MSKKCCCNIWKYFWMLHHITLVLETMITVLFWGAFFGALPADYYTYLWKLGAKYPVLVWRLLAGHLFPFLFMVLDFYMIHGGYRVRHLPFVILVCGTYGFGVNMPQALLGNPYYGQMMNWSSVGSGFMIFFGTLFSLCMAHGLWLCLTSCKYKRCYKYKNLKIMQ